MPEWDGAEMDLTESKRAEEAQHKSEGSIRRKNQSPSEAHDQAQEVVRLKSDFLTMMSHEIRTPLNAIIGMTEMLMDTPLDDEQCELAGIVRDAGQALLIIINDVLDFSEIEAGKLALEHVEFEPAAIVEGVADTMAARAREKHLSLVIFVDPDIPDWLRGDPGRLRQILLNMVGNAVKFTGQGKVVVRATVGPATEREVSLRITVSDTGIGLSEGARRWLFQPFTQAYTGTTRKYGGTGLGLAISSRLAKMMGGEIGVESVEGQGSTFWFIAPFERVDTPMVDGADHGRALLETPTSSTESRKEAAATTGQVPAGPRALIPPAEDSQVNRETVPPQVAESPPAPIMLDNLREITGNDPALLCEFIGLFLQETPPQVADIHDAVDRGDAQALEQAAHKFKSGSGYMGAQAMVQLCIELEALGRSGTTAGASELVERLLAEYENVKTALGVEAGRITRQGVD